MDRLTGAASDTGARRELETGDRVRTVRGETGEVEAFEHGRVVVRMDADVCCNYHAYHPLDLTRIGD